MPFFRHTATFLTSSHSLILTPPPKHSPTLTTPKYFTRRIKERRMSVFYSDAAEWNPDCLFLLLVHHLLDLGTNVAEVASAVDCT